VEDLTTDARKLSEQVGQLLIEQGKTLALAESCTGGLVASLITDIAGSSTYFLGSAVAYAYEAKEHLLGVAHETLIAHGAVSPETAREMAQGARRLFEADLAMSVTGIAGPGGATPEKPVGLVCIHLSAADAEIAQQHIWPADRIGNKMLSAQAMLALALRYLKEGPVSESVPEGGGYSAQPATAHRDRPEAQAGSLPDFPDESVAVDVHLLSGRLIPSAFTWRGRRYAILSVGRQWPEEREGTTWRCYLVQTRGPATFELRCDPLGEQWRLARAWGAAIGA